LPNAQAACWYGFGRATSSLLSMPSYRPCMANASVGPKLGAASNPQILSLEVVLFKGAGRFFWPIFGESRPATLR
jgi:hypothetical protein